MASHALYRAWRPQCFGDMVGQEHVARTLLNALRERRTAHAYLLTGPRGTGKTSAARILAKAMNCLQPIEEEPCNACSVCVSITQGRSLDVIEIDGASNRGIDQMRDLREKVNLAPAEGNYRFYIIDEVHQLTAEAFNALLKTLEEPPAQVVFVLATTDPQKLPPTVVSRCQHFTFHRIADSAMSDRLRHVAEAEQVQIDDAALALLTQAASGSLRDGLSLLDQAIAYGGRTLDEATVAAMLGLVPAAAVEELMQALAARDASSGMALLQRLVDEGHDPKQFARQFVDALHDRLCAASDRRRPVKAGELGAAELVRALRLFSDIQFGGRSLHLPQLPLELALVEWCTTAQAERSAVELPTAAAPTPARVTPAVAASRPSRVTTSDPPASLVAAGTVPPPPSALDGRGSSLVAAGVSDDLRRSWLRTLAQLKAKSPKLNAFCNSCQLQGVQDTALVVTTQVPLVREQLNVLANRQQVEEMISAVFGHVYTLKCLAATDLPPTAVKPPVPASTPPGGDNGRQVQPVAQAMDGSIAPPPISFSPVVEAATRIATTSSSTEQTPPVGFTTVPARPEPEAGDPLIAAAQDPVVQEVLRVFRGGRVEGIVPHSS